MENRAFNRIPISLRVRVYSCNEEYEGIVSDLSEKGMLITIREMSFPFDLEFSISISFEEEAVHMPVRIVRLIKSPDSCGGMGIELLHQAESYMNFVKGLRQVT